MKNNNGNNISVILPVVYLNTYSTKALHSIAINISNYKSIDFIIVCSSPETVEQVKNIIDEITVGSNCKIICANNRSSNFLRGYARNYVETPFVIYQDCDDYIDYNLLIQKANMYSEDSILCFNIVKRIYSENNIFLRTEKIYQLNNGPISRIDKLPTNIVNKVIPTTYLDKLEFYDLPFSQDLSLSYQLFSMVDHVFLDDCIYTYEFYPSSSSKFCHTELSSLKQVDEMRGILIDKYKGRPYDIAFLKYRYDILLGYRYNYLGVLYPIARNFRILSIRHFGLSAVMRFLYHYAKLSINQFVVWCRSRFMRNTK